MNILIADDEPLIHVSIQYTIQALNRPDVTVFNAANERAVSMFLNRKIGYLTITDIIESAMRRHTVIPNPSVEQILEAEQDTYDYIESRW